jgi:hypothetical protein
MNRQELFNRLALDYQALLDNEINNIPPRDPYSLVFKRQCYLAVVPNVFKLQLSAQASVIAGFQGTWTEMAMYLDGCPDGPLTDWIGGVLDETHIPV